MIDVHVLTHSATRPEWLAQCLDSLKDEPCTVHVVPGVEGNIAAGRAAGFALGVHPYVTFVDSDDYVLPGAMAAMCGALELHDAAVSQEQVLVGGDVSGLISGHHLHALRRNVIAPHLGTYAQRFKNRHCSVALRSIAAPAPVPVVTYVWRMHDRQSFNGGHPWQ